MVKSSAASKWASKHHWGNIYFAGDGTTRSYTVKKVAQHQNTPFNHKGSDSDQPN